MTAYAYYDGLLFEIHVEQELMGLDISSFHFLPLTYACVLVFLLCIPSLFFFLFPLCSLYFISIFGS